MGLLKDISTGNISKVKVALDGGLDLTHYGNLPILRCFSDDSHDMLEMVQLLIDHGADIHALDEFPLTHSVTIRDYATAKFLIKKGADVNARNNFCIDKSVTNNDYRMTKLLIKSGSSFGNDNNLIASIEHGNYPMIKLMLKGINVHLNDDLPLLTCIKYNNYDTTKLLIKCGANIHAQDEAALVNATEHSIIKLLIKNGAKIDARNGAALKGNIERCNIKNCKLLIANGATVAMGKHDDEECDSECECECGSECDSDCAHMYVYERNCECKSEDLFLHFCLLKGLTDDAIKYIVTNNFSLDTINEEILRYALVKHNMFTICKLKDEQGRFYISNKLRKSILSHKLYQSISECDVESVSKIIQCGLVDTNGQFLIRAICCDDHNTEIIGALLDSRRKSCDTDELVNLAINLKKMDVLKLLQQKGINVNCMHVMCCDNCKCDYKSPPEFENISNISFVQSQLSFVQIIMYYLLSMLLCYGKFNCVIINRTLYHLYNFSCYVATLYLFVNAIDFLYCILK